MYLSVAACGPETRALPHRSTPETWAFGLWGGASSFVTNLLHSSDKQRSGRAARHSVHCDLEAMKAKASSQSNGGLEAVAACGLVPWVLAQSSFLVMRFEQ